jgi:hypothetical protein
MTRALERVSKPGTALGGVPLASRRPEHLRYAAARYQGKDPKLFCVPLESGEEALPVFSSSVAAQGFIFSYGLEPEWHATGFSVGELISLLVGPCVNVDWILLDPFPGCLGDGDVPVNLMHWQRFADHLLG